METMISTQEIAETLGLSVRTVRAFRTEAYRRLYPQHPPFPKELARGWYRPRDVAAWCKAVGREYPKAWEKA